jgi:hypothetical protein
VEDDFTVDFNIGDTQFTFYDYTSPLPGVTPGAASYFTSGKYYSLGKLISRHVN